MKRSYFLVKLLVFLSVHFFLRLPTLPIITYANVLLFLILYHLRLRLLRLLLALSLVFLELGVEVEELFSTPLPMPRNGRLSLPDMVRQIYQTPLRLLYQPRHIIQGYALVLLVFLDVGERAHVVFVYLRLFYIGEINHLDHIIHLHEAVSLPKRNKLHNMAPLRHHVLGPQPQSDTLDVFADCAVVLVHRGQTLDFVHGSEAHVPEAEDALVDCGVCGADAVADQGVAVRDLALRVYEYLTRLLINTLRQRTLHEQRGAPECKAPAVDLAPPTLPDFVRKLSLQEHFDADEVEEVYGVLVRAVELGEQGCAALADAYALVWVALLDIASSLNTNRATPNTKNRLGIREKNALSLDLRVSQGLEAQLVVLALPGRSVRGAGAEAQNVVGEGFVLGGAAVRHAVLGAEGHLDLDFVGGGEDGGEATVEVFYLLRPVTLDRLFKRHAVLQKHFLGGEHLVVGADVFKML